MERLTVKSKAKKKVVILRGPSGSGKSTWVKNAVNETHAQVMICSADDFFMKPIRNDSGDTIMVYQFDVTKLPEAHQRCFNAFLMAIGNGEPCVVVDNTNERRWEYMNYELAARMMGYEVEIVEFVVETMEQARLCAKRNTHGVPLSVIAAKAAGMETDTRATRIEVGA